MTGTPSITLPSSSPLSHSPDIGEAVVGKDESKERRRKWQRRYTLFWLIRKLTQLMKSAVRIGDYCLANVLMNIVGPTLILFVLGICFILVNTFWNVFYPWLGTLRYIHAAFVAFVTMQVLFNYAMCVYTSNSSKIEKYARVVRQLAAATPDFTYPETPQQLEQAKRDYLTTIAARRAQQQQSVNYYPWTLLQPTVKYILMKRCCIKMALLLFLIIIRFASLSTLCFTSGVGILLSYQSTKTATKSL